MLRPKQLIAIALVTTMLTACTEPNGAPGRGVENGGALDKQDVGTGVGALAGGLIGSAFGGGAGKVVMVVGGALLGGVLGNIVGKSMDDVDREHYDRASQRALQTGQTRSWSNPDTGNHGSITPYRHYTNDEGQYCRTYTQTIYIDGEKHVGHGNACRQSDGSWKIVD